MPNLLIKKFGLYFLKFQLKKFFSLKCVKNVIFFQEENDIIKKSWYMVQINYMHSLRNMKGKCK